MELFCAAAFKGAQTRRPNERNAALSQVRAASSAERSFVFVSRDSQTPHAGAQEQDNQVARKLGFRRRSISVLFPPQIQWQSFFLFCALVRIAAASTVNRNLHSFAIQVIAGAGRIVGRLVKFRAERRFQSPVGQKGGKWAWIFASENRKPKRWATKRG